MLKVKKLLIISTGGTIGQKRDATDASVRVTEAAEKFAEILKVELDDYGYTVDAIDPISKDSSNIVSNGADAAQTGC